MEFMLGRELSSWDELAFILYRSIETMYTVYLISLKYKITLYYNYRNLVNVAYINSSVSIEMITVSII